MFWILFAVVVMTGISGFAYMYMKRWRLLFTLGKALVKSTFKSFAPPSSIKLLDDLLIIKDPRGVIILPYKRVGALKAVNSQVWLISGNDRKRLNIYPGFDFNLSPRQIKCDLIEVNHQDELTVFKNDERFDWNKI
jgi:hypothetical protein